MELTIEQIEIIELSKKMNKSEILIINACAGSGKTFTLNEIALANPNKKFLYLAFNKNIVEDMKKKAKKNIDVKTLHSLAFSFVRKKIGKMNFINSYTIFDIEKFFPNQTSEELFLILKDFNDFLINDEKEFKNNYIKKLWNLVLTRKLDFIHNFYLKYYFLYEESKNLVKKYDFILLDEAQDTNSIMLDIVLNNNCSKILVGDTFQNIYGFNQTINAIETVQADYKKNLSKSFRSKQEILNYADYFLLKYTKKNKVKMTSNISNKEKNEIKNKSYIMRTNAGIIEFLDKIKYDKNIEQYCLLKNPDDIFQLVFDILNFRSNRFSYISKRNSFLLNFNSMLELKNYAKEAFDNNLNRVLILIDEKYDFKVLNALAIKLYNKKNKENIFFYITNSHISKGLEWDSVELYNDFPNLNKLQNEIKKEKNLEKKQEMEFFLEQEVNLFYVAITRAKFKLLDKSENKINDTAS
ncbi:UvrD-helicase domain-containing protein [Campylobacter jejuni]|uniref:AAA family ATPase n=1 Tax=Campylobacter jejuni TaxID=197 RepID=UPI002581A85B|nr:AAA family ATPase [Campylobacter jejuni]BEJ76142.1 UvrD-helicase domain-containing protein [Campylobacter jejuni]GML29141.1 UvrD-helicase domain-containing protein [Campylobacter jejuni]GMM12789.1 UvrD-helicase domain-containing protein [Campylobacter jejuni]HDV6361367.1 ATP-dependent helicase [Campylobacter jejuni]HDV6492900.1 ATP-dependent helicase [Campylobacter jejuni]